MKNRGLVRLGVVVAKKWRQVDVVRSRGGRDVVMVDLRRGQYRR